MGWQKRGTGRSYDSPSGHGTFIGNLTGKILGFDVRIKTCRVCDFHKRHNSTVPSHNCQKNWSGSSKGMEPDVAETVLKGMEKKGLKVDTLIMDDDTTTLSRIRSFKPDIVKWSDLNHTKKHLGNSLYSLAKKHKGLSTQIIKALQRWFGFAIKQNKNDVKGVRDAIKQIVPHAFGQHDGCGNWCKYNLDPDNFKHKTLPQSKDLTGDGLKTDLAGIFDVFVRNAEKIAPAASTKEVESFNNVIASKAPKRCHYSGSESLRSRVNCAVAQKNMGHTYVSNINTLLGISPGKISALVGSKRDRKRKQLREIENSREHKKRKIELKSKKSLDMGAKETREGVTYKSGVATETDQVEDENNNIIITEIPAPIKLVEKKITVHAFQKVVFDLETTSLNKDTEITQIAAVCDNHEFNQYVLPLRGISHRASEVTGLTCHGDILLLHGRPVHSYLIKEALQLFLAWLSDIGNCVLIAHNAKFDAPRIMYHLQACKLTTAFVAIVHGFCDSLPLFKEIYPGMENYKQETLVSNILKESYEAHNALGDVQSLQKLLIKSNVKDDVLLSHGYSSKWLVDKERNEKSNQKNAESLNKLVQNKVLSNVMANKIANSGLHIQHLYLALERGGSDGLKRVFAEDNDGSPRITKSKAVLTKLVEYLEKNKKN